MTGGERAVTAVAHRGAPYVARENTLASFRAAISAGADAVELDVRLTRDGVPVVLHDRSLNRLWGHDVAVAEVSAERLATLAADVPTFAAALEVLGPVRTMVDLPEPKAATAAVAAVREAGAGDRVYYCGDPGALRLVRDADPGAELALTWNRAAPVRPTLLDALRPRWLNYGFGLLTAPLVERAHADGYLVSAWTADSARTMRRLTGLGADSITTNHIARMLTVLGRPNGTSRPDTAVQVTPVTHTAVTRTPVAGPPVADSAP